MKSKSKQRHVVTSCGDTSSFWSFDFLAGLLKLLKPAHSHSPTHPTKLEKSIRKKLLKLKFPPREAEKTHLRRPMLLEFFGGSGGTEGGVWSWESRMDGIMAAKQLAPLRRWKFARLRLSTEVFSSSSRGCTSTNHCASQKTQRYRNQLRANSFGTAVIPHCRKSEGGDGLHPSSDGPPTSYVATVSNLKLKLFGTGSHSLLDITLLTP